MATGLFLIAQLFVFLKVFFQNDAKLIVKPLNAEVLVNQSTYFNCSTSNTTFEIAWYHYAVGTNDREDVYDAGAIRYAYRGRFNIEKNLSKGVYNLIVRRPKLEDSGRYECQDIRGIGDTASAELIVLARDPIYWSNSQSSDVIGPNSCGIEPDKLKLSCTVAYYGNIPPQMQWKKNNISIREGVTQTISANNVTYILSIGADLLVDNSSFVCETSRFANNQYSCYSPVFKVQYAIKNYTNVTINTGDEVVCFVNSSQLCNYKWKWVQGEDVSVESSRAVLRPKKPGWHWCTAECTLRDEPCTIEEVMSAFVFEAHENQSLRWHGFWVLLVIIPIVAGLIVYRRRICRKNAYCHSALDAISAFLDVVQSWMTESRMLLNPGNFKVKVFDISHGKRKKYTEKDVGNTDADVETSFMVNDKYGSDPLLVYEFQTKASTENKMIRGLTILDKELFVVSNESSKVEIYDSKKFSFSRGWILEGLIFPVDIVSCNRNKCLYIMNGIDDSSDIFRVDPNGNFIKKWKTGDDCGLLSVTHESNVISTV